MDVPFEKDIWLRQNSMRRQTLHGFPEALTPWGIRSSTPRLGRLQPNSHDPATLDPRLPRPAKGVDMRLVAPQLRKDYEMKLYDANPPGGILNTVGSTVMKSILGGSMSDMKAAMKLIKKEPEFMKHYLANPPDPEAERDFDVPFPAPGRTVPKWQDRPQEPWKPPQDESQERVTSQWLEDLRGLAKEAKVEGVGEAAGQTAEELVTKATDAPPLRTSMPSAEETLRSPGRF
eukprot:TRINITY_DN19688_c0_g2_i3.p1 TRINITY_DN19688_c0_g2~~TRINITY_DN19688_c0_g2_i3.p1  ORF type:complete len:232 (+),score=50.69 TRINITY_DN19688_c0_g2_i3:332-1027(+)